MFIFKYHVIPITFWISVLFIAFLIGDRTKKNRTFFKRFSEDSGLKYIWSKIRVRPLVFGSLGLSIIGISLIIIFLSDGGEFINSIIPELIGFCLEGLFFVALLHFFRERDEKTRRQQIKMVVGNSLIGVMMEIAMLYNYLNPDSQETEFTAGESITNRIFKPEWIILYRTIFAGKIEFFTGLEDVVQRIAENVDRAKGMTPIVALLHPLDLYDWDSICRSLENVCESSEPRKQIGYIRDFLLAFARFEDRI